MITPWHALHAHFQRSISTHAFQREFQSLRQRADLRCFPDPVALLDYLHAGGDDHERRNRVLAALVSEAQQGGRDVAVPLLLTALWPGLDAVYRRLSRYFRGETDELAAELCARVVSGIHGLDFGRVTWIAATLIRNVERDTRRRSMVRSRITRCSVALEDDGPLSSDPASVLALPCGVDADTASDLIRNRLAPVLGTDAALVVAVAVNGDRQHEAAEALGVTAAAARKRYQRSVQRLRREFS